VGETESERSKGARGTTQLGRMKRCFKLASHTLPCGVNGYNDCERVLTAYQ